MDRLFIGNEASARNPALLASLGITHIVNLNGYESRIGFPEGFQYCIVKLRDSSWETLTDDFWAAVQFVKKGIDNGGSVLCHCRRGISRSAALCIAYLMEARNFTVEAALGLLKQRRPIVDPGQGFLDQLKERERSRTRPESGRKRMLVPHLLVGTPRSTD
jgi:dual specificity MAP kinase phosphatase